MSPSQFEALLNQHHEEILCLFRTKGAEYACQDNDCLANFKESGEEVGVNPETALYFALNKHLRSIRTFLQDRQLGQTRALSEPISGRIRDAQLYLSFLEALVIESERRGSNGV